MNKSFTLVFSLLTFLFASNSIAQKARFGSVYCEVQKADLPYYYVEPSKRTYTIKAEGRYSDELNLARKIFGWTRVEENPNFKVVVSLDRFEYTKPYMKEEIIEKKDDDGNVTERYVEYSKSRGVNGTGKVRVYSLMKPKNYFDMNTSPLTGVPKEQSEKDAEKSKKLEENPFLTKEDVQDALDGKEEIEYEQKITTDLEKIYVRSLSSEVWMGTQIYRNREDALLEYEGSVLSALENAKPEIAQSLFFEAMKYLNQNFGFQPVKYNFNLKQIKNDDFPDYKTWQQAVDATKTLMGNFRYNKGIDDAQQKFEPIISFFESQVKKYSSDDRKQLKIKKAALYNLYYILYYLDEHEKLIRLANKYLDVKKLDKGSAQMLAKSERQQDLLLMNKMNYSHLVNSDVLEDDDDLEIITVNSTGNENDADDDDE